MFELRQYKLRYFRKIRYQRIIQKNHNLQNFFRHHQKDLLNIVEELHNKGVDFISLKENIDTTTPQGKFMLTVFGALAELEREQIHERQAEGIAIAKAAGKYKGRKPMEIDREKFDAMVAQWRQGDRTATSIIKAFNITGTTFYRWIKNN